MRLIDADALGVTDFEIILCDGDYKELCKTLIAKIESAPTIDAIPVVRCRDCEFNSNFPEIPLCPYMHYPNFKRSGNGYCSNGRPKN